MSTTNGLVDALRAFGGTIPNERLFPTIVPEAASFALSDPFAFALAASLDRGARAEVIWTIPYDIKSYLGDLDPLHVRGLSISSLEAVISALPRKPRYRNDAPRTIHELAVIVCDECDGDAAKIWKGKRASEVKQTFLRIHGVGHGIANMAVLLIEKAFDIRFPDLDRPHMDIKADVHTMRVLYRLGAASSQSESEAVRAARMLSPSFPGEIDAPLWFLGRQYCRSVDPDCLHCPVTALCYRVGLSAT